jgi:uncharacterized protein YggE
MNRSITLSTKGVLVAAVAALALVVAYLLGSAGGSAQAAPGTAATTAPDGTARTLVATGTGKSIGVPDQLTFALSVGVTRGDLKTALADASATTTRVLAALAHTGVRRADVQTTGLSMNAVYDYHSYGPPTLRGYHVSQRAQVLVRDLAHGGPAVSAAVAAGGNDVRVGGIRLRIGDQDKLLAQARRAAVAQATAKAKEYAAATGQTLGPVQRLRETHAPATPTHPLPTYGRAAMDSLAAAPPIRAGRDKLSVTVRIVWQFG